MNGFRTKAQSWLIENGTQMGVALAFMLALVLFFALDSALGSRHFFGDFFGGLGTGLLGIVAIAGTFTAAGVAAFLARRFTGRLWIEVTAGLAVMMACIVALSAFTDLPI